MGLLSSSRPVVLVNLDPMFWPILPYYVFITIFLVNQVVKYLTSPRTVLSWGGGRELLE